MGIVQVKSLQINAWKSVLKVTYEEWGWKSADKPGSVMGSHSSGTVIADGLVDYRRR